MYVQTFPKPLKVFKSLGLLLALRAGSRGARPEYYLGPEINTKRQDATKHNQMSHANEMRTALPPCGWDKNTKQQDETKNNKAHYENTKCSALPPRGRIGTQINKKSKGRVHERLFFLHRQIKELTDKRRN